MTDMITNPREMVVVAKMPRILIRFVWIPSEGGVTKININASFLVIMRILL